MMVLIKIVAFLTALQNRETFFRRISMICPTLDWRYKLIEKAYNDAKDAFREKYRDGGERYFEHIRGVALIQIVWLGVTDHRIIVAALLHDIVEDCPEWTIKRVQDEYGDEIALLVEWMTKPDPELYGGKEEVEQIYNGRFEFAPRDFFLIKMPDRLHNLMTLWGCTKSKRQRKIIETRAYYLPFAKKHQILYQEISEALEILERGEKIM